MDYESYFKNYSNSITNLLSDVETNMIDQSVQLISNAQKNSNKVYIIGNGGSASIASHVSVDFSKVTRVFSSTFNNSNLITCFANDYGYDNWVTEAIKAYTSCNDIFIFISSSGKSKNILNAAKYCKNNRIKFITFSGFKKNNLLSQLGNVNFYVNSNNYNFIEMVHHIILVSIVDIFSK